MIAGADRADDQRGTAEVIEPSAVRRARSDERRLSDLQLVMLQKARRSRRRAPVRH